jgi:hypothetical protein
VRDIMAMQSELASAKPFDKAFIDIHRAVSTATAAELGPLAQRR